MINEELEARDEFYNLAYILLTEKERSMPKYTALKQMLDRMLTEQATIKANPELDAIVNAIANEGYTFKQAIVRYLGVDYLNAPDNSMLYNDLLKAAIERKTAFNNTLQNELAEQQKQGAQLAEIREFCIDNNLEVDNFIAEMQQKIAQPIESNSMNKKHLLGYKIAIDVINEIQNNSTEPLNPATSQYKIKPFLFNFCGRTYLVNENCCVITIKEFLEPNKALNTYVQLFAEHIQENNPNKWEEIVKYVEACEKVENITDANLHTIKFITEKSNESAINSLKKQKELLKNEINIIKKINDTARIVNITQALAIFWEMVADLLNQKINWEELAIMTLNDILMQSIKNSSNE